MISRRIILGIVGAYKLWCPALMKYLSLFISPILIEYSFDVACDIQ